MLYGTLYKSTFTILYA